MFETFQTPGAARAAISSEDENLNATTLHVPRWLLLGDLMSTGMTCVVPDKLARDASTTLLSNVLDSLQVCFSFPPSLGQFVTDFVRHAWCR